MDNLITYHSTVVSYDINDNTLYHGTNFHDFLIYELQNNKLILKYEDRFLGYDPLSGFYLTNDIQEFDIINNDNKLISLMIGGRYLSARVDGSFNFKDVNSDWEQFSFDYSTLNDTMRNFIEYKKKQELEHKHVMLACCCGNKNYGSDWFSTDYRQNLVNNVFKLDITQRFPFRNSEIDFIYIEHGLEHVDLTGVINFCKEAFRCLKYNGVMRLASPSLDNWIKFYIMNDDDTEYMLAHAYDSGWIPKAGEFGIYSKAVVFNAALRKWGHTCLLDFTTYKQILQKSGFTMITKEENGLSKWPDLNKMEKRKDKYSLYETLIMEARK